MATLPTIVLSGELDMYEAPAVRAALAALEGPGVVDLTAVTYIDSSALSELARLARRVGLREITLVVTSSKVRRIFTIVGFDALFRIVDGNADLSVTA